MQVFTNYRPVQNGAKMRFALRRLPRSIMNKPYISVVIPIYNEECVLPEMYKRVTSVMDAYGKPYELVLVNDGSSDSSIKFLENCFKDRPDIVHIVDLNGNHGQYMAIAAGFQEAKGEVIVNLDADMQNPPEEIPVVLKKFEEGHDYVGSYRKDRQDSWFRTWTSKLNNRIRHWATGIDMTDQGCMLRAYSRKIVDAINASHERSIFISVLGRKFAGNPAEVGVEHHERAEGESKYGIAKLMRINFDLFTGFSLLPLQLFTFLGLFLVGITSILLLVGIVNLFFDETFTLLAYSFIAWLLSFAIFGIGLLGEYLGRAYHTVQGRPRFLIKKIYRKE